MKIKEGLRLLTALIGTCVSIILILRSTAYLEEVKEEYPKFENWHLHAETNVLLAAIILLFCLFQLFKK